MLALLLACAAPGVLVVTLDTTRADVVQPGVLPDGARQYTYAYSAAPWTSSSTYTLTTGRYPDRPASQRAPWDIARANRIPRGYPVDAGLTWHDVAVTDSVAVEWVLDVERVADPFDEARDLLPHGGAIYVHDLGPHQPYAAPLPSGIWTPQDQGLIFDFDDEGVYPHDLSPGLRAWGWHAYHDAAADTLARVRPLLDDAIARGWTVILTADHGEALGEGGRWGHSLSLDDEQTRVPLLVWGPGVVPGTDDTLTPATCVAATVRAALGEQPMGCDLRTGDVRGVVEVGMLSGGAWVTRRPGEEE